jgi:hypothetical protein
MNRPQTPGSYDSCHQMAATAATEFTVVRQHVGNNKGVSSSRTSAADPASCLTPVAENEVHGLVTDRIGLPEPYRYGDSNPGFRTENWLWKAN